MNVIGAGELGKPQRHSSAVANDVDVRAVDVPLGVVELGGGHELFYAHQVLARRRRQRDGEIELFPKDQRPSRYYFLPNAGLC